MYNTETRIDELARLLRDSGYRLTPQRLGVVRALVEAEDHPSAEAVYSRISEVLPTTSLATVYNTLEALREMGQVLEIHPAQGPVRFDIRRPARHAHLICRACGRVDDVPGDSAESAERPVRVSGWSELDAQLDYYGLCPGCRRHTHD